MITYLDIVNQFQSACQKHLAIKSFYSGPLDFLDAANQDLEFPYIFLRPMSSPGIVTNNNGYGAVMQYNFEMYSLDVPHLTDPTENIKILSNTSQYGYDIISDFNFGLNQQNVFINSRSITPVHEAFNDRTTGWVYNLTVITPAPLDYCTFPQL